MMKKIARSAYGAYITSTLLVTTPYIASAHVEMCLQKKTSRHPDCLNETLLAGHTRMQQLRKCTDTTYAPSSTSGYFPGLTFKGRIDTYTLHRNKNRRFEPAQIYAHHGQSGVIHPSSTEAQSMPPHAEKRLEGIATDLGGIADDLGQITDVIKESRERLEGLVKEIRNLTEYLKRERQNDNLNYLLP